ncbi:MAG: hypothetical protein AVO34_13810 [Firmicutes bacterium ML8_F2]|jgi:hypothetical protein|nr:MAG: hypothetical protein AVO34_13810 [Firmicutes bacterium ML8_F2]
MTRFKTLIIVTLTAALLLSLGGCDFLSDSSTEPTGGSGDTGNALPEWLLLAHRNAEDPDATDNEVALNLKERDDENDEAAEEDILQTEQPETTESSQQEPIEHSLEDSASSQTDSSSDENSDETPEPGTMDYIIWKKKQEEAAKDAKEQEKDENLDWWEDESDEDSSWF